MAPSQQNSRDTEDSLDLDLIQAELENCLARITEKTEAHKGQLADLNIHTIPEALWSQLETIADFQIAHKLDDIDEISTLLGISETVLKKIKNDAVQRELRKGNNELGALKKQLDKCSKIISRDESKYKEEKLRKEDTNTQLKAKAVLLESELNSSCQEVPESLDSKNSLNSLVKQIRDLHVKSTDLDGEIEAEEAYLKQFSGLPPSLSDAAKIIEDLKEKIKETDAAIRVNLDKISK